MMPPSPRIPFAVVALVALLAAEAAAQGHFYYGHNKVQYARFDWHVLHTEHFDIVHDADAAELARIAAAEAERFYTEMVHRFGIELPQRVPLIVYATNLHFRQTNIIPGFIPQGVGGFFEFVKGRVVVPADGDIHRFRRVIRHELVHVFTFTRLGQVLREHRRPQQMVLPLWFVEGLAEYWSGAPDHQHEMVMRDAVASNLLVRLEDLDRVRGFLIYKQGESICEFIAETYGEDKLALLIEHAWRETSFRRVMEYVLREDFHAIAERYDRWVRARYYPVLATALPASLAAEAVVQTGFSARPLAYTAPDGSPAVVFVGNRRGYTNIYSAALDGRSGASILVRGERGPRIEGLHLFESRMDVSRDGRLVFVSQSGGADVLPVFDLEARELLATHRPGLVAVYSPAWDPRGERVVFAGIGREGFSDLFIYDLTDATLTRLTDDAFDYRDPDWSPCGRFVVFASDRGRDGAHGAHNLFAMDLEQGSLRQLTHGVRRDSAPRWSDDGQQILFASARRDADGQFGNQDVWVLEHAAETGRPTRERRLTSLTSAAFDPSWTPDGGIVLGAYERGRFGIRHLPADALPEEGLEAHLAEAAPVGNPHPLWEHPRYLDEVEADRHTQPYRRRYSLEVAYGAFAQNPVWGTAGGGALALSDLLGDDRILLTAFFLQTPGRSLLDGLNLGITRIHLAGRANFAYGAFRLSGLRFDRTDPDAHAAYPVFFEQMTGAFGAVSYPLSRFQRIEASASLGYNVKEVARRRDERAAMILGPSLALIHDNALYGANGPIQGWKARLSAGVNHDLFYGNVSNVSLSADARHYLRLGRHVTLASWALVRTHQGREARLWLLGGSWDLRGFPFLGVRGRNQWFTSHELRFSIAEAPSAHLPLLAPFGIANVRGALFVDAARAWNDYYDQRERQLLTGRTLGAVGAGVRVNLFGGLVLRYDVGWRFEDGFAWGARRPFGQFFFGYDF